MDLNQDEDEPTRLRMRLIKKKGDLSRWYSIFDDMKSVVFEDTLLAPKLHHGTVLTAASSEDD